MNWPKDYPSNCAAAAAGGAGYSYCFYAGAIGYFAMVRIGLRWCLCCCSFHCKLMKRSADRWASVDALQLPLRACAACVASEKRKIFTVSSRFGEIFSFDRGNSTGSGAFAERFVYRAQALCGKYV